MQHNRTSHTFWTKLHPRDLTLIFVGANSMALNISRRFLIPCLASESDLQERGELLDGFEAERYRALVANRMSACEVDRLIGSEQTRSLLTRLADTFTPFLSPRPPNANWI